MEQGRFIVVAGTLRNLVGQTYVDIPTFIRVDTQTGKAWFLEGVQGQGIDWFDVAERGQKPLPGPGQ